MTMRIAHRGVPLVDRAASRIDVPSIPAWKRAFDVFGSVVALVLLAPVMALAAIMVRLSSRGPILFRQERIGLGEKPYTMFKFRTMTRDSGSTPADREAIRAELDGTRLADAATGLFRPAHDARVTRWGRLLRRLSIDELPQLFNVLRGEMSLVGPRPALPWEVEMFDHHQRQRHSCAPGITGLWQVSGRNRLSSQEMLALDLEYAANFSPWLDIKILLQTPRAVFLDRNTS